VALDQLEMLLELPDYAAAPVFRNLAGGLRRKYGEPVQAIESHLRRFDHEAALAALRALRARMPN